MKKVLSVCLVFLLIIGILPTTTYAAEAEDPALLELKQALENNSVAEIRDAEGNVIDTLDIEIQVQQINKNRSSDAPEYLITATARSANDTHGNSASKDGVLATIMMVCKDVWGPENILISITGSWSGTASETTNRVVTYTSYNILNVVNYHNTKNNVGVTWTYTPVDYTGFTFKATSKAEIVETGHDIYVEVATDPSVLTN